MYASKADILAGLTEIHERTLDDPAITRWFGGALLIREITAAQRIAANAAATADNPDEPDQALYRAMLLQMAVVDPDSGRPYADGRIGPDGQPQIDPRTRRPLFSAGDLPALLDARDLPFAAVVEQIVSLAALLPRQLKSGDRAPDGAERDAGAGAGGPGDAAGGAAGADADDGDARAGAAAAVSTGA